MRKRLFGLLASAGIALAACQGAASPSPSAPASTAASPSPAASASGSGGSPSASGAVDLKTAIFGSKYAPGPGQPGGTIVMGEWQPTKNLHPFYSTSFTTFEALGPIMRGLLTIDSDGKYINDLGDGDIPTTDNGGVKVSGNTFTIHVKIKSGLLWSDGQPLTLNDFKWTWEFATDKAQSGCTLCTVGWTSIDKVTVSSDGLEADIHFKELYAGWLGFLTGAGFFLPEHYFKDLAIKDAPKSMAVGPGLTKIPWSGPFKVSGATADEIDYVRNDSWKGGVGGAHPAYLDGLKFKYFADKNGMIAAFLKGDIDLALDMTLADYPAIKGVSPDIGIAELKPAWQYEHLDLQGQHTDKGLDKLDVRKAIAMSINKEEMLSVIFPGQTVTPACSPSPPGQWFRVEGLQCPPYDVEGAKKLLDGAGMTAGSDGNRTYNGKPVDLQLCTTAGNPTRLTELQKLQGYLQAVGIKSHIDTGDADSEVFATWAQSTPTTKCSIYRGNYDIADYAYVLSGDIYNSYYFTYHTTQWPEKGDHSGANTTRFSNPYMDKALDAVKTEVDLAKQGEAAATIQKIFVDNTPEIPLYYRAETTGISTKLQNWPTYNVSSIGPTWNVEDWWCKGC
jgi:peptide/nickel transport system substrate-binding protein